MIFAISVLSFVSFITGNILSAIELFHTIINLKNNVKIHGTITHTIEHAVMLFLILLCNFILTFWLFCHIDFIHSWEVHIIEENLWSVFLLIGVIGLLLSEHLKKERTNYL